MSSKPDRVETKTWHCQYRKFLRRLSKPRDRVSVAGGRVVYGWKDASLTPAACKARRLLRLQHVTH